MKDFDDENRITDWDESTYSDITRDIHQMLSFSERYPGYKMKSFSDDELYDPDYLDLRDYDRYESSCRAIESLSYYPRAKEKVESDYLIKNNKPTSVIVRNHTRWTISRIVFIDTDGEVLFSVKDIDSNITSRFEIGRLSFYDGKKGFVFFVFDGDETLYYQNCLYSIDVKEKGLYLNIKDSIIEKLIPLDFDEDEIGFDSPQFNTSIYNTAKKISKEIEKSQYIRKYRDLLICKSELDKLLGNDSYYCDSDNTVYLTADNVINCLQSFLSGKLNKQDLVDWVLFMWGCGLMKINELEIESVFSVFSAIMDSKNTISEDKIKKMIYCLENNYEFFEQ